MNAKLSRKSWLFREWEISVPAGCFNVTYSGHGHGFETVFVDAAVVVRTRSVFWYVPRFEFAVGEVPALLEVRVWPWMTLRAVRLHLDGVLCYCEGSWP